ncbi:MAG: sugar phosphate transferase [Thermoproteus sp.]|nr:sugar phosphate transferase [Thermoproteus sp.]
MELAIVGDLRPRLLTPPSLAVVGGFRIVELVALALCESASSPTIYIDGVDLGLPFILRDVCRFSLKFGVPDDVPKIDVGIAPFLLKSLRLDCGGVKAELGTGDLLKCDRLSTYADLIAANREIMELALAKLRSLGVELIKGDVGGVVKGPALIWGRVHEYTYIAGPAVVGPNAEVLPFSYIRPGSALYYGNMVRDEVKNSVMDAFSYKEHLGYLGDSYISAFVNFGAGTTVSNLKNTLGPIRPSYSERTYKKLGPVVGEFVKTSIGSLIYGGKYIGPLSHVYGLVDRDVPPLTIFKSGEMKPMDPSKIPTLLERDLSRFGLANYKDAYLRLLQELRL